MSANKILVVLDFNNNNPVSDFYRELNTYSNHWSDTHISHELYDKRNQANTEPVSVESKNTCQILL